MVGLCVCQLASRLPASEVVPDPEIERVAGSRIELQNTIQLSRNSAQIKVSQAYYHGIPGEMEPPPSLSLLSSRGVHYRVENDKFIFWTGDSTVDIELSRIPEKSGFSKEEFRKVVVESFSVTRLQ